MLRIRIPSDLSALDPPHCLWDKNCCREGVVVASYPSHHLAVYTINGKMLRCEIHSDSINVSISNLRSMLFKSAKRTVRYNRSVDRRDPANLNFKNRILLALTKNQLKHRHFFHINQIRTSDIFMLILFYLKSIYLSFENN